MFYKTVMDAIKYDHNKFGGTFGKFLKSNEQHMFRNFINKNEITIDVGCGTGKLGECIDAYTIGVDESIEMLKYTRAKIAKSYNEYVVCDAHHLPFKENLISSVLCSRCLMHLESPEIAISEFCRVTAEYIILDYPNKWSGSVLHMYWRKFVNILGCSVQCYQTFSHHQIKRYFYRADFMLEKRDTFFFIPTAIYRLFNSTNLSLLIENKLKRVNIIRYFSTYSVAKFIPKKQNPYH